MLREIARRTNRSSIQSDEDTPPSSSESFKKKKIEKIDRVLDALLKTTMTMKTTTTAECNNNNNNNNTATRTRTIMMMRATAEREALVKKTTTNLLVSNVKEGRTKKIKKNVILPLSKKKKKKRGRIKETKNVDETINLSEHYRDVFSLARISEQFQTRVVALQRMKELSNDEVDFTWVNRQNIFAPGSLKARYVEVADGVADNDNVIQNEADIQKKREVYALKTALRSANGLARYLQIPPMKETTSGSDKKQTHERLRKEARRKRDLVLEMSKKTILDAYKEMTTKADETKKQEELKGKDVDVVTNEKTREDLEIAERASRAREPNRTTKEKPAPATKNKPAVAVAARINENKQKRTSPPFSPPRVFGREITNN